MRISFLIFAYFSPETMLPLSSVIASLAGFAMLIKRSSIRFLVQCCRAALRIGKRDSGIGKPHFPPSVRKTEPKARA
jgi:hypothetical protein